MNTETEKITFATSIITGSGTMFLDWADAHAAGIGAICTMISVTTYLLVTLRNEMKQRKARKNAQK